MWRTKHLGEKPKRTWKKAVIRYLRENEHKKSFKYYVIAFRTLSPYFEEYDVQDLTRGIIIDNMAILQDEREISNARVNRLAAYIRALINVCRDDWEWMDKAPKVRMLEEGEARVRWITQQQAQTLISVAPKHLKKPIKFALSTGLRKTNLFELRWSQVDMQRQCAWIHATDAKGKRAIPVPLNQDALNVLKEQIRNHEEFVFTYADKPFKFDYDTWHKTIAKAGIEDFHWHDLRHTWASWHVQAGTTLQQLMELGGWRNYSTVLKYAHLNSDHLIDASNRIVNKQYTNNVVAING